VHDIQSIKLLYPYRACYYGPYISSIVLVYLFVNYNNLIMNIAAQPYYSITSERTLKQWHHVSYLHIYCLQRRHFIVSYVQLIMQQYESTTV